MKKYEIFFSLILLIRLDFFNEFGYESRHWTDPTDAVPVSLCERKRYDLH